MAKKKSPETVVQPTKKAVVVKREKVIVEKEVIPVVLLADEPMHLPKFANIIELKTWLRTNPGVVIEQAEIVTEKKRLHDLSKGKY